MPHLRYCNRYWYVAGDELSCPALCSLLSRIVWTALVAAVYGVAHQQLSDCDKGWVLQVYLLISIFVFVADIVVDAMIILVSMRGTMTAMAERKQLGALLTTRIGLICMQTACSVFGILTLAAHSGIPCDNDFENQGLKQAFIAVVVASQLFDSILFACCGSCLIRSSSTSLEDAPEEVMQDEMEAWMTWAHRCQQLTRGLQLLSCNLFGGGQINEGFEDVAKALMQFFHHSGFLDVVASDVVAGFVLVRLEQRLRKRRAPDLTRNPYSNISNDTFPDDKPLLKPLNSVKMVPTKGLSYHGTTGGSSLALEAPPVDLESGSAPSSPVPGDRPVNVDITHQSIEDESAWYRGSIYALAMYTHLMALYVHPCSGMCRLFCSLNCGLCRSASQCADSGGGKRGGSARSSPKVVGDNCCGLHYAGMSIFTNLIDRGQSQVLYASYANDTNLKPFGIFLDHEKQWVVVSIRGTLSLEDCITDVTYEPWELVAMGQKWGFEGANRWGHSGMVRAADRIREELDRSDVLKRIYANRAGNPGITTPLTEDLGKYSHYRLTVIGHSLGAGTAVLLAMMLRNEYPSLRCLGYGVPASVLDAQTCREVSSFVTSIVLDSDLVSRLSFRSLCNLRNDVLDAISRARVNKVFIMKALFHDIDPDEVMYPHGQEPDSEFKRQVEQFKATLQARIDKMDHELFLPGRIIHIARVGKVKGAMRNRFMYHTFERNLEFFTEITVSSTMVPDHLPDRYTDELARLGR